MITAYLKQRLESIGYALKGFQVLISSQPNARLHAVATVAILVIASCLRFESWEWVSILLCIGMVWLGEALNTALELLADEVSLEQRPLIGKAKDVAAAGVLIASLASLSVAGVILLRHL